MDRKSRTDIETAITELQKEHDLIIEEFTPEGVRLFAKDFVRALEVAIGVMKERLEEIANDDDLK